MAVDVLPAKVSHLVKFIQKSPVKQDRRAVGVLVGYDLLKLATVDFSSAPQLVL